MRPTFLRAVKLIMATLLGALVVWAPTSAEAQPTYSIDFQGPSMGTPDLFTGTPITEGDILTTTFAPVTPPGIVISGGPAGGLGLPVHPTAIGHPGGVPGGVEVDALSFGTDLLDDPAPSVFVPRTWCFSVDEFAFGLQPIPAAPPNVSTEGASGLVGGPGIFEAHGDVYGYFPPGALPPGIGPVPPFAIPPGNTMVLDGDGLGPIPFGLGLIETPGVAPTPGTFDPSDNVDALDMDVPVPQAGLFPVYFSLDGPTIDVVDGLPANSGSAPANLPGGSGADVLVTLGPGGPPLIYAPGPLLGLDLIGANTDDLDALVLRENGDGIFTPSMQPYDWAAGGPADMLFFSVRRASAIIGTPDFYLGLPIVEGDILVPAGPPGTPPGIWIAAENLGLCTWRGGVPTCTSVPPPPWGPFSDDLNALDFVADCDDNGIPDSMEIALGLQFDGNGDGVPDNCQNRDFIRGDCNADGNFDISDPIFILSALFTTPSPLPTCDDACDSNDDGLINIADAVYMLSALFSGGPPPPAPHPNCGADPTPDVLTCIAFPPCP